MNGKLVADKYRIESLIRESDSGDLYVGRHETLEKAVTVKVLASAYAVDPRWVKRFVSEARAASALAHHSVLNITDFGTDAKGITYAVFERADGKTLRDIETTEQPIDENRALDLTRQIAAGVAAAHGKKIVHGSLDPNNIFVNDGDDVKVYGFGSDPMNVARDADPRYLAPEQCNAFPAADERSDVYALGVILYEMLAGAVPYEGKTAADILAKQNIEPPAPLSSFGRDLHPEIEPIVLSAMALDPERRYPNMAAFAEDLEILSGRLGGSAPAEVATAAAAGAGSKRNIWQTAIFVFAGIAIFAAALIYATSVRQTDPTTNLQADAGSMPVQPIGSATGAQEEALARLPIMTEAEIMAASAMTTGVPGDDGFGDGYNAWDKGGIPPVGAPLTGPMTGLQNGIPVAPPVTYMPQGGEVYTIQQGGQSQFMPDYNPTGGVELRCRDVQTGQEIPCPSGPPPTAKPAASPKTPAANTAVPQATPEGAPTPKPMATPPPKTTKPAADQPGKGKPAPTKPAKSGTEKISEELSQQ